MMMSSTVILCVALVWSMAVASSNEDGKIQEKLLRQGRGSARRALSLASGAARSCISARMDYLTGTPSGYYDYSVQTWSSGPLNCEGICRSQLRCRAFVGNSQFCYLFESLADVRYNEPGCYRPGGLCADVTGNATFQQCSGTSVVSRQTNVCESTSSSSSKKYFCYKDSNRWGLARWTNNGSCQSQPTFYDEFVIGSGCANEILMNGEKIASCATHDLSPLRHTEYTGMDIHSGLCSAANFLYTSFNLSPQTACSGGNSRRYCSTRTWGNNYLEIDYELAECGGRQFRYMEVKAGACVPKVSAEFEKHNKCGLPSAAFPAKSLVGTVMGLKLYSDAACTIEYGAEEYATGLCAFDGVAYVNAMCNPASGGNIVRDYSSNACVTGMNIRTSFGLNVCVAHNGGFAKFWKCA